MNQRLRCFIRGYVRVRLIGNDILRLLNMCKSNSLVLRKIIQGEDGICCDVLISDLFRMLPLLKKTHTRIMVLKKVGIPFWIETQRRRIIFWACLFGCIFMLNAIEQNVWAIEYIGNSRITSDQLSDFIKTQNICFGMRKSSLNMQEIEKNLREEFSIVTWVSVYFEGTKLCIELKENEVIKYSKENNEEGSNLIATETGTVTSIVTRNGVPKVKIGDQVEKGQILVEGLVPIYDDAGTIIDYQIYEADADICVNTLLPYADSIERRYSTMQYTGRVQNCFFIEINHVRYEIPGFMKNFERYEKVSQKWQCFLLEDIYLPLFCGTDFYREYQLCYQEYTEKELETMLYHNFRHFMETLEGKGVQIIEKNVKISNDTHSMYMMGEVLVNKQTGAREAIDSALVELIKEKDILEGANDAQKE